MPPVAEKLAGIEGESTGVADAESDHGLSPRADSDRTWKSYAVPFVSPVTSPEVVVAVLSLHCPQRLALAPVQSKPESVLSFQRKAQRPMPALPGSAHDRAVAVSRASAISPVGLVPAVHDDACAVSPAPDPVTARSWNVYSVPSDSPEVSEWLVTEGQPGVVDVTQTSAHVALDQSGARLSPMPVYADVLRYCHLVMVLTDGFVHASAIVAVVPVSPPVAVNPLGAAGAVGAETAAGSAPLPAGFTART